MRYGGLALEDAAAAVMFDPLLAEPGSGGLIAIDGNGNIAMPFNTERMYRGSVGADAVFHVALLRQ
jgi:beta-aspartyl-peptidase (threonine type)